MPGLVPGLFFLSRSGLVSGGLTSGGAVTGGGAGATGDGDCLLPLYPSFKRSPSPPAGFPPVSESPSDLVTSETTGFIPDLMLIPPCPDEISQLSEIPSLEVKAASPIGPVMPFLRSTTSIRPCLKVTVKSYFTPGLCPPVKGGGICDRLFPVFTGLFAKSLAFCSSLCAESISANASPAATVKPAAIAAAMPSPRGIPAAPPEAAAAGMAAAGFGIDCGAGFVGGGEGGEPRGGSYHLFGVWEVPSGAPCVGGYADSPKGGFIIFLSF